MRLINYVTFGLIATAMFAAPLRSQTAPEPVKLEMHGLVQVWAAGEDTSSTFRIRRTELKLNGSFTNKLRWQVQIDPVRLTGLLQDAMLSYAVRSDVTIDVGQYKVPFTREGTMSSSQLETAERTLFASGVGRLADVRDIGAQVRYTARWGADIRVGVFNSLGGNDNLPDRDTLKSLMGQVTVAPAFLRGVALTSSGGISLGDGDSIQRGDRFSAGVTYAGHGLTARTEYLRGKELTTIRIGYYGLAAYRLHPRVEAVGRYDVWDPDTKDITPINLRETDYTAGLTYFIDSHLAKLQVNYMRKNFENRAVTARNMVIMNAQAAW